MLDDFFSVALDLMDGFPMLLWALLLFVLLSAFTVLNMLIGVLCEVVSATQQDEKEKAMELEVRERLTSVFMDIDVDGSGKISQNEFELMKENEEIVKTFEDMGIEPQHLMSMGDSIFGMDDEEIMEALKSAEAEGRRVSIADIDTMKELEFEEFLDIILRLRPERGASVLDFADLRKGMRKAARRIEGQLDHLMSNLMDCEKKATGEVPGPSSSSLSFGKGEDGLGGSGGDSEKKGVGIEELLRMEKMRSAMLEKELACVQEEIDRIERENNGGQ